MDGQKISKSKLKYLQSLKLKKYRQKYDTFLLEGRKVILEIINHKNLVIKALYAEKSWIATYGYILENGNIRVFEVTSAQLKKISALKTPDQVCAEIEISPISSSISRTKGWIMYLDRISDPGNLGTMVRTSDWFGVGAICLSPGCADLYNPKTLQASKGSFANVPIHRKSATHLHKILRDRKWYFADLRGQDIRSFPKPKPGVLVIGNESQGISSALLDLPHTKLTIPHHPGSRAESLNASVAAAVMLSYLVK